MTVIQPTDKTNYAPREVINDLRKQINFPPICIDHYEEFYSCVKCTRKAIRKGEFLFCETCKGTFMFNQQPKNLFIKASFQLPSHKKCISINIPHSVIQPFIHGLGLTLDASEDDIKKAILQAKNYALSYINSSAVKITEI